MAEKITVEIDAELLELIQKEVNCAEALINYAKEIDHVKFLSKFIAEVKNS